MERLPNSLENVFCFMVTANSFSTFQPIYLQLINAITRTLSSTDVKILVSHKYYFSVKQTVVILLT